MTSALEDTMMTTKLQPVPLIDDEPLRLDDSDAIKTGSGSSISPLAPALKDQIKAALTAQTIQAQNGKPSEKERDFPVLTQEKKEEKEVVYEKLQEDRQDSILVSPPRSCWKKCYDTFMRLLKKPSSTH